MRDIECEKCEVNKYCGTRISCEQAREMYEQGRLDGIVEALKRVHKHFEEHLIYVFGKDEVLDELAQIIDEYYIEEMMKEKLKEQKNG